MYFVWLMQQICACGNTKEAFVNPYWAVLHLPNNECIHTNFTKLRISVIAGKQYVEITSKWKNNVIKLQCQWGVCCQHFLVIYRFHLNKTWNKEVIITGHLYCVNLDHLIYDELDFFLETIWQFYKDSGWRHVPETILQLIVIGWNDFPGDSAGLGGCPWGTILQLAVIGWKAELPWEPRVTLSPALGRVGVCSPAARPALWTPAGLPDSVFMKTADGRTIFIEHHLVLIISWHKMIVRPRNHWKLVDSGLVLWRENKQSYFSVKQSSIYTPSGTWSLLF